MVPQFLDIVTGPSDQQSRIGHRDPRGSGQGRGYVDSSSVLQRDPRYERHPNTQCLYEF